MREAEIFINYIIDSDFKYKFLSSESSEIFTRLVNEGFYNRIKHFKNASKGPDVIIEYDNFTILLDHFEFDSSKLRKKSSSYRINAADIDRDFENLTKDKTDETITITREMKNESSTANYVENLMRNLNDHNAKTNAYIENYMNLRKKDVDKNIELGFIIEVVSPLPDCVTVGDELYLITPFNMQDFRDFLKNNFQIKHIFFLCKHDKDAKVYYFNNSLKSLDELKSSQPIVGINNDLIFKNPHTITSRVLIPTK
jgi:hypothetical protein